MYTGSVAHPVLGTCVHRLVDRCALLASPLHLPAFVSQNLSEWSITEINGRKGGLHRAITVGLVPDGGLG